MYTHTANPGFHADLDLSKIEPIRNRDFVKPYGGFWLSIDESWERWCSEEEPEWLKGTRYKVNLAENAKIISVKTLEDLEFLPKRIPECVQALPKALRFFALENTSYLDFEEIARYWDVIEVYAGSNYKLYNALYGWDVDSALVLNPKVIKKVSSF